MANNTYSACPKCKHNCPPPLDKCPLCNAYLDGSGSSKLKRTVRLISVLVLVVSLSIWFFVPQANIIGEEASRTTAELFYIALLSSVALCGILLYFTRSKTTGTKVKLVLRLVGILFVFVGIFQGVWIFIAGPDALAAFISASATFIIVGAILLFFTRKKED